MKILQVFTTTLITMFLCCTLSAQCPEGSLSLTSQQQVDDFAAQYPSCTEIEGSLVVSSPTITDLTPLNNLTSVTGDIVIYTNDNLGSLSGLENIETIGGNLHIGIPPNVSNIGANNYGNSTLTDLSGLGGLRYVGENLEISGNTDLMNVNGLSNLETVEGSLTIGRIHFVDNYGYSELYILSNNNLMDLNGLANLNHVGGIVQIVANPTLNNIEGLGGLSAINGDFNFYANHNIANFAGLNITNISGDFILYEEYVVCEWDYSANERVCFPYYYGNNALINLEGMENLTSIGGSLIAIRNNALIDLSGLENLADIEQDLQIANNDNLANLTGINSMTNIGRNLQVIDNDMLADFNGLGELITIGGDFDCYDNDALSNFNGLDNLASIGGNLVAGRNHVYLFAAGIGFQLSNSDEGNDAMTDFSGLENLTHIGGTLTIGNNDALNSLSGLDNVTNIGGLSFYENDAITDFVGLNQVDSIKGDVFIGRVYDRFYTDINGGFQVEEFSEGNDALIHVSGLSNLKHVDGNFNIADNESLIDFMGLNSLQSINGDFNFHNNNQAPDLVGLSGLNTIGGNFDLTYRYRLDDYFFTIYESNHALTSLTGLENLNSINGDVYIQKNTALTNLNTLTSLDYSGITELTLIENPNLSACSTPFVCAYLENGGSHTIYDNAPGCNTTTEIQTNCVTSFPCPQGNVTLTSQQQVNDFASQYPDCTEITGDLYIGSSDPDLLSDINDLSLLSQLTAIQGRLTITKNAPLTSLDGLENLMTINGNIFISTNPVLSSLADWDNLTSTGGNLAIRRNALSDLTGFNSLISIGSYINIGPDSSLISLAGLENLTSINGYIHVQDNTQLNSLNGLDSIDYTTITNLRIRNNPELSICDVTSICNYVENGGISEINNNAFGCNTVGEIEESCLDILPIEMTAPLSVYLNSGSAILRWRTDTETNNAGFEIQRSKDGINWEKIAWQNGQGTTTTSHRYTHRDTDPLSGTSYCRLKQLDFDGNFEYSNIISLRYDKLENLNVYPVPATDFVVFDVPNIAAADEIILYDIMGKQISRQAFPQDKQLAVSHLNDGVYIYRIFYENEMYSGKIVVE